MQVTKDVTSLIPFHSFIVLGDLFSCFISLKYPDRDKTCSSAKGHKTKATPYIQLIGTRSGERTNSRS